MSARGRGWKYCSHCERAKPLAAFYVNGRGNPQNRCKSCHRFIARQSYRRAMRDRRRRRELAAAASARYYPRRIEIAARVLAYYHARSHKINAAKRARRRAAA